MTVHRSAPSERRLRSLTYGGLVVVPLFQALSAVGGGIGMVVADGLTMRKSLLADSPFSRRRRFLRRCAICAAPANVIHEGKHGTIENRVHRRRAVTFEEDRSQVRTGSAPQVMATLRNTVVRLLRLAGHGDNTAARRHHARTPGAVLTLLPICRSWPCRISWMSAKDGRR